MLSHDESESGGKLEELPEAGRQADLGAPVRAPALAAIGQVHEEALGRLELA